MPPQGSTDPAECELIDDCGLRQMIETGEADRLAAYRRALAHIEARGTARMPDDEPPQASTLPHIDPAAPGLRTRWFRTRREALQYAENAGFQQRPERRRVWVDLAWREEWSLRAPSTCLSERTT